MWFYIIQIHSEQFHHLQQRRTHSAASSLHASSNSLSIPEQPSMDSNTLSPANQSNAPVTFSLDAECEDAPESTFGIE